MPLNDPYAPRSARAPRMRILHNGAVIGGALSFNVHQNGYYQADGFSCSFAFNATPETPLAFWGDPAWDSANPLLLDIQASLDGGLTFTTLLTGQVDHVTVRLERGIVEVEGRDRTAAFIDNKTQQSYQNMTSSQIVETLASSHGLEADVTPTTTPVGRYYEVDHERIGAGEFTRTTTEWNLICSLAAHEEYDVWVTGNTIHFHPKSARNQDPYLVVFDRATPYSNAVEITAERSLSFSKDITVVVKSFSSRQGRAYSAHSGQTNAPAGNKFVYTLPNLTQAECQAAANRIRADLSRHERLISWSAAADLTLSARNLARLQGTATSWDQLYRIDSVNRSMSFDGGFTMNVQAKSVPAP